ncbi:MAG TPA: ATP-binding cassette domain-containing protein, partial [Dehalococcoidia bacterium]|nr:ATP-binding cassette domain-containing protein [Dehalococcoidia bacterium]
MDPKIETKQLNFYYGKMPAVKNVTLNIREHQITALIGPSGCGKSTFLRTLNRMNDIIIGARVEGEVLLDKQNIYERNVDVVELRKRVGMVFQHPNPFPKSIRENVAFGPKMLGLTRTIKLNE